MLIIFDIDGTLCDTQEVDARCHNEAFEAVTGRSLATVDWSLYPEATSAAIIQDLLSEMDIPNAVDTEQRILEEFIARLDSEARRKPDLFLPRARSSSCVSRALKQTMFPLRLLPIHGGAPISFLWQPLEPDSKSVTPSM